MVAVKRNLTRLKVKVLFSIMVSIILSIYCGYPGVTKYCTGRTSYISHSFCVASIAPDWIGERAVTQLY